VVEICTGNLLHSNIILADLMDFTTYSSQIGLLITTSEICGSSEKMSLHYEQPGLFLKFFAMKTARKSSSK
jgi:hypothetical protein